MMLEKEIYSAIAKTYPKAKIDVINESHLHAGHAGDDGTGESHWRLKVSDESLMSCSRIARHRAIHAALGQGIINRIHALAIEIS